MPQTAEISVTWRHMYMKKDFVYSVLLVKSHKFVHQEPRQGCFRIIRVVAEHQNTHFWIQRHAFSMQCFSSINNLTLNSTSSILRSKPWPEITITLVLVIQKELFDVGSVQLNSPDELLSSRFPYFIY